MEMLEIGDLVRHALPDDVHTGAMGIIIDTSSTLPEVKVRWLTVDTADYWMLTQNIETVDE